MNIKLSVRLSQERRVGLLSALLNQCVSKAQSEAVFLIAIFLIAVMSVRTSERAIVGLEDSDGSQSCQCLFISERDQPHYHHPECGGERL